MDQVGAPIVNISQPVGFYRRRGKRLFDLALVVPALILLAPVLLVIALLVKVMLGRPVFFCQTRPGLHGKLFRLLKFRTMREAMDKVGNPLPDEQRLTRFGKFLRATSLDELPELWNILRGEMSFVGPRPLLVEYLDLYTAEQMRRHEVSPGLTGLAQVQGRNELSWEEKFYFDSWYVDSYCFSLDVQIFFKTIYKVLSRQGVSQSGHVTTEKFAGNGKQSSKNKRCPSNGVIVLGAGGHAAVIISTLRAAGYEIHGAYDDAPNLRGRQIYDVTILGSISDLPKGLAGPAIVAIGDAEDRRVIVESNDFEWISLIHPKAYVDQAVHIAPGTVVMAGAVIQPGCRVGNHTIVNTSASIDHDCVLGDFVHICPGAHLAGSVSVGTRTLIGTGSVVIPGITIGSDVIVGAGAVVTCDLPDGVTAVGNPAQIIKKHLQKKQAA